MLTLLAFQVTTQEHHCFIYAAAQETLGTKHTCE